ncbi:hypothetical protein I316_02486 [Kwoniella heveanensis BCC8398]|uniref:NADH:flavin oxidoreductase/NADH oxidase N-terminal domain-containing protein n=1 Tax=Kwoniella heveanensis BCC8398 TaxID=1296120 RepID=A0A1B9GY80_9TREE|nr:hypothetical protein I316_02486 [Kwoniella heveanensis BCC8398]
MSHGHLSIASMDEESSAILKGTDDATSDDQLGNELLLFEPMTVGDLELKHRVVMCPLTRCRADAGGVHSELAVEYYKQRASDGGLLITEGTIISQEAGGQSNVPGIYSFEQIEAWKRVTAAVHEKGGFIFSQLWALGRVADPAVVPNGKVYAPSDIPFTTNANNGPGCTNLTVMSERDLDRFVEAYVDAARGAMETGFDGVEVHAANGYLLDQFLQTNTNTRSDNYGGSPANRIRLIIRVLDSISAVVPPSKIGIRISPFSTYQGMKMSPTTEIAQAFQHLLREVLSRWELAYVHIIRGNGDEDEDRESLEKLKEVIRGSRRMNTRIILAGEFDPAQAREEVRKNPFDELVAFGRYFIANPDLPYRIRHQLALSEWDETTFYTHSAEGYIE